MYLEKVEELMTSFHTLLEKCSSPHSLTVSR